MLLDQIKSDLRTAQLARDEIKVSTLRLLLSEIKNREIVLRQSSGQALLSDEDIVLVIQREIKKRKEGVAGFRSGGNEEAALKEEKEAGILEAYLPQQMTNEELVKIVEEIIREVGASSISDMGKIIGVVMGKVKGKADGSTVSGLVKERLSNG